MNIKKTILSALLMMGFVSVSAQEQPKTEYVFNPHWYVQAQIGGQYTLGEIGFSDLLSPNAQVGVGYNFSPVVGLRGSLNFWQSKAGITTGGKEYDWKWNYVAPHADVVFNLSNLFCGYNPNRIFNFSVLGGIGANIAFGNDEAGDVKAAIPAPNSSESLVYLWDGSKVRLGGRLGVAADFRLSDKVSLGLEVQANTLNDHYNSKKAGNADWFFNALAGVKINLGKTHTTRTVTPAAPVERVVERVVEKVVEKPVPAPAVTESKAEAKKEEAIRRDVFFTISAARVDAKEEAKVKEIAEYLKRNPGSKVTVTGYADKATGNPTVNKRISVKRAQAVADMLVNKYGISFSRIVTDSKGDTEQPFVGDKNRVSICIAE